jgi:hypothetical protein
MIDLPNSVMKGALIARRYTVSVRNAMSAQITFTPRRAARRVG